MIVAVVAIVEVVAIEMSSGGGRGLIPNADKNNNNKKSNINNNNKNKKNNNGNNNEKTTTVAATATTAATTYGISGDTACVGQSALVPVAREGEVLGEEVPQNRLEVPTHPLVRLQLQRISPSAVCLLCVGVVVMCEKKALGKNRI